MADQSGAKSYSLRNPTHLGGIEESSVNRILNGAVVPREKFRLVAVDHVRATVANVGNDDIVSACQAGHQSSAHTPQAHFSRAFPD
jgi:hypothetical protein